VVWTLLEAGANKDWSGGVLGNGRGSLAHKLRMLWIRDGRRFRVFLACVALLGRVAAAAGQGGGVGGQARNLVLGTQNRLLAQVRSSALLSQLNCKLCPRFILARHTGFLFALLY